MDKPCARYTLDIRTYAPLTGPQPDQLHTVTLNDYHRMAPGSPLRLARIHTTKTETLHACRTIHAALQDGTILDIKQIEGTWVAVKWSDETWEVLNLA